jgi:ABC-type bacteriocin/lantibiotic exporter with double-glycine peptidase domain
MSNDISKLIFKVLKTYCVPITHQTIAQTVQTHPEYPNIQSISDALDKWKVKHVVLRISLEKLQELDVPVISWVKRVKSSWKSNEYIWITQVNEVKVHFRNASGKEFIEDRENFKRNGREWR